MEYLLRTPYSVVLTCITKGASAKVRRDESAVCVHALIGNKAEEDGGNKNRKPILTHTYVHMKVSGLHRLTILGSTSNVLRTR